MDAPRIVRDGVGLWRSPHRPAGAGLRIRAFVFDALILLVFVGVSSLALWEFLWSPWRIGSDFVISVLAWGILASPLPYFVLLECSTLQGTLGKCMVGIKVTDMDGGRITLVRSAGRTLAKVAFGLAFPPSLLFSLGLIAVTKSRQAIHDGIADTLVLLTEAPPGGPPPPERDMSPAVSQTRPDGITPSREGVQEPGP